MSSRCPKCHRLLEEEEVCCAEVRYTWRCLSCFKLTTGFVLPYGKCSLCGGEQELIPDRNLGDCMRFQALREAMQFELEAFCFYNMALEKACAIPWQTKGQRLVLEHLYQDQLDHLHELEQKYRAHLDSEMLELASDEEKLNSDWPFRGIRLKEDAKIEDLYRVALEAEQRARDHFRALASRLPEGLEKELCREMAAEEDEHAAMLQTELEQLA
jgi:glutamate synthase (NADPH) small chain